MKITVEKENHVSLCTVDFNGKAKERLYSIDGIDNAITELELAIEKLKEVRFNLSNG